MKAFRFIKRYKHSDWLQVVNADTLEEAKEFYDYDVPGKSADPTIEVQELSENKGCVLAFHITPGQATK